MQTYPSGAEKALLSGKAYSCYYARKRKASALSQVSGYMGERDTATGSAMFAPVI